MKIKFKLQDGYASQHIPYEVDVNDQELAECTTTKERIELIDEIIEDWVVLNILPDWKRDQLQRWEKENEQLIKDAQKDEE